tara:strand:+ start:2070 stop:2546 length:477 start_codon:yes stop_codon:yes gene_type:complete
MSWIFMPAKFEGTCELCKDACHTSSPIYWDTETKKIRHESCHSEQIKKFDWKEHTPKNGKIFRHGDLLIREITEFPNNLKRIGQNGILAEGEVTGHFHKLEGKHEIYDGMTEKFFEAFDEIELKHNEHKMLKIPKGKYIVIREQEYNPYEDYAEEVYD